MGDVEGELEVEVEVEDHDFVPCLLDI